MIFDISDSSFGDVASMIIFVTVLEFDLLLLEPFFEDVGCLIIWSLVVGLVVTSSVD
jgi:hypothetical protein